MDYVVTLLCCSMFIQFMPRLFIISQDDITGDGTTSNVLIIGELLKQVKKPECQVNIAKVAFVRGECFVGS